MPDPKPFSHATPRQALLSILRDAKSTQDFLAPCRDYLATGDLLIRQRHQDGAGGLETARARAGLLDELFKAILTATLATLPEKSAPFALVATGAYGRSTLNPRSSTQWLLLLPLPAAKLKPRAQAALQQLVELISDLAIRSRNACESIVESIKHAKADPLHKIALMDARLVGGSAELFQRFEQKFSKECLNKGRAAFFELRRQDVRARHHRFSRTVFLQEPNVKESCGGLDDYHNIRWVCLVKRGDHHLSPLVDDGILTANARREIEDAVDFLHRVRNELHYHTEAPTDLLTLMLQGVVSVAFHYPQRDILRRTEAFMRDYYRHTLNLYQHTGSLMEVFQIEQEDRADGSLRSFLTFRKHRQEEFDGFIAREGRIHPVHPQIFVQDPNRMMRLFQHCQLRNLRLSPLMRQIVIEHWDTIDRAFRCSKTNRETFQGILERKGEVAGILRKMHRVGFLGRYLPEFGPLDCLVQHEFFHRYTADEHTLRCIDQLDQLVGETEPRLEIYRRLFHEIEDPYALYLAVILHDSGRAENVREHIDGSAMLASRLCNRLQIRGPRRSLIMFLVDNHLIFWRTATTRNLEDPEVIAEFAAIVKTRSNLDALFLFTYADSNATSPESWTGWKESLMLQLHASTRRFLDGGGRDEYARQLESDRLALRSEVLRIMRDDYRPDVERHFDRMPGHAFHFRQSSLIVTQIRCVRHFLQREAHHHSPLAHCIKWIDHTQKGYTELVLATYDKPLLLEKLCCALAANQFNILSADFITRTDGIVVDVFRVCTTNFEPVADAATRKRFVECFDAILADQNHDPERHLLGTTDHLEQRPVQEVAIPVQAFVSNKLHPICTTVEIQALDRIGLLHDLFLAINQHGLNTTHARICTERGVAMDTLYITTHDGEKVIDPDVLDSLSRRLASLIGGQQSPT